MQQQPESKERKVVWIGPDQVTITGEEVVIETRHPMPDWRVRDSNNIPIYFEDKKYIVAEKSAGQPPFLVRYVLQP